MEPKPDDVAQRRRLKLIKIGEQFGSQDTLDQANQSLDAAHKYAKEIEKLGFGPKQIKALAAARDGLLDAGVGRQTAKGKKKVNGRAYVEAMNQGLTARLAARAVLTGVQEDLEELETAEAIEGEHEAATALQQTSAAADEAEPLAQQLLLLLDALKKSTIAAAGTSIGGPEAVVKAEAAIGALRKADQTDVGVRGTPVETAQLDLLDGTIVQLTRRARRAAAVATKQLGNPALLEAFKLDKLYRSKAGGPPADESEEPSEASEASEAKKR